MKRNWIVFHLALFVVSCAAGNTSTVTDGSSSGDLPQRLDGGPDAYVWPDLGPAPDAFIYPDGPQDGAPPPDNLPDLGFQDQGPPDSGDAQVPCADPFEPNESCSASKSIGTVKEGSTWIQKTATLHPGTDVDWFRADGEEKSHTCMPLTSQCYTFKVRVEVPAGRNLKVCVYEESCSGSSDCADNASIPGPAKLDVEYNVSGTCALNDDTDARILVEQLDNKGGCAPYTVAFNYDEC